MTAQLTRDASFKTRVHAHPLLQATGSLLVIATLVFNMVLCALSTKRLVNASSFSIAMITILILVLGFSDIFKHQVRTRTFIWMMAVPAVIFNLKLINPAIDLKIVVDLAIPVIFFHLGQKITLGRSESLMRWIFAIVVVVGLFEWLRPEQFQQIFNVWDFYVAKGALGSDTVNYSDTSFAINGVRAGDGRTILPWLFGVHRISSVFLEPVSMGNFAIISLAWSLAVPADAPRRGIYVLLSLSCMVLPDSRYAMLSCIVLIVLYFTHAERFWRLAALFPVIVASTLYLVGLYNLRQGENPQIMSDDFSGRLLFSAKLLASWGPWQWFGLAPSPVYTADTGYAYLANGAGLPVAMVLLLLLANIVPRSAGEARFKTFLFIYIGTSLCVGASMFSIKTGGLLWFLYGSLHGPHRVTRAARDASIPTPDATLSYRQTLGAVTHA